MIVTFPPDMLDTAMMMVRGAELCPDAMTKSIVAKWIKDPEFVGWMAKAFGGTLPDEVAKNTIKYYKDNF